MGVPWRNSSQMKTLPGFGPVTLMKRPVRTRMQGVVGRAGEKPALTRLGHILMILYVY